MDWQVAERIVEHVVVEMAKHYLRRLCAHVVSMVAALKYALIAPIHRFIKVGALVLVSCTLIALLGGTFLIVRRHQQLAS